MTPKPRRDAAQIQAELAEAGVPLFLRKHEVAELLRVDARTIGRWIAIGRLPTLRASHSGSSRALFRRSVIAELIARMEGGV
jgi:excisionase family DNA binding protein